MPLPTDLDAVYADDATDPSVKEHQQQHDALHGWYNQYEGNLGNLGIVIVETATGVWSGDAPARVAGERPITFVGVSDPADPTNGIATPANIADGDRWEPL